MGQSTPKRILFLCTGNYYRSRFAEMVFNFVATRMGLPWRASSRGLALERGVNNVGPMAVEAVNALKTMGPHAPSDFTRIPMQATEDDFQGADWIVALKRAEHLPLLQERFPSWTEMVEYWHVEDASGVLPTIEREVMELAARLIAGGRPRGDGPSASPKSPPAAPPEKRKAPPVLRLGRETKGRRGNGVTIISDLPLDAGGVRDLAATLKNRCGTGGTVKDGRIEIQGDQRERLTEELRKMGYTVKRAGG